MSASVQETYEGREFRSLQMYLNSKFFEKLWSTDLHNKARAIIDSLNLECEIIGPDDESKIIREIRAEISSGLLGKSGPSRLQTWNRGWAENQDSFSVKKSPDSLIPKYFGKSRINRLEQKFVLAKSQDYELLMLRAIQSWVFTQYFEKLDHVYEYGCGTGHNLVFLHELFPNLQLKGLDWSVSSQSLIGEVKIQYPEIKIAAENFDLFNPNFDIDIPTNAGVLTVASLEQLGNQHEKFVTYLMQKRPKIVVHIEPFQDLLDPRVPVDRVSIDYMVERNYISGYVESIQSLEQDNRVKIMMLQRSFVGSKYIDGYTLLVWSPIG
jgi:hypothetical protein